MPDRLIDAIFRSTPLELDGARADLWRMIRDLDYLRSIVLRHTPDRFNETAIPGLRIMRTSAPTTPTSGIFEAMFCLVLQGAKEVTIGDRKVRYDPASYLVASLDLPAVGFICEASVETPYLCISLGMDQNALAELMLEMPERGDGPTEGFAVSAVTPQLLDAVGRMLELLDTPDDIPVLAPAMKREVLYRLLQGEQGAALRQIARADSRLSQTLRALRWIRSNFGEPINIDRLADIAGMSRASFHRHFRAATAMSPLQFQKTLRLQEARRLLIANADAQHTAFRVGYESASQFSREYARMFGMSPLRDAARLRSGSPLDAAAL